MLVAEFIIVLFVILAMGWVGRMDGHAPPDTPEWFERVLCMVPVLALAAACHPLYVFPSFAGVIGIITGHGQYFLSRAVKAIEPEKIDFIIRLFFGKDPRAADEFKHLRGISENDLSQEDKALIYRAITDYGRERLYWRNVAGLSLGGSIVTIPLSIILIIKGAFIAAPIALAAGAQKGLSYMAGYKLADTSFPNYMPQYLKADTEISEYINRAVFTALIYAAFKVMTA